MPLCPNCVPDLDDQRTRDILWREAQTVIAGDPGQCRVTTSPSSLADLFEHADTLRDDAKPEECGGCVALQAQLDCVADVLGTERMGAAGGYHYEAVKVLIDGGVDKPVTRADVQRMEDVGAEFANACRGRPPVTRADVRSMIAEHTHTDDGFVAMEWSEAVLSTPKPAPFNPTKLAGWGEEQWALLRGAECEDGSFYMGGALFEGGDGNPIPWRINWQARRTLDRLVCVVEAQRPKTLWPGDEPRFRDAIRKWLWVGVSIHENGGYDTRNACIEAALREVLA